MEINSRPSRRRPRLAILHSEQYIPQVMPKILGTRDLTSTYIIAVFFIVNAATAAQAGAGAFTYLFIGAIAFFLPSALATAQLGRMFPHEGSLYNWTHKAFGGYWSFFIGVGAWFPGVLVMIAGSDAVITLLQSFNNTWLVEPWQQGLVIVFLLILSCVISIQRTRVVQNLVNMGALLIMLAVVILAVATLVWYQTGHASMTNWSDLTAWQVHWSGEHANINLFGLITLAYLGTEVPLNMGGEMKGKLPASRHIFWGTLLTLIGYSVATFALLSIRGGGSAITPVDLITLVDMTLGKFWGNIFSVFVILFFVIVPVVYNSSFARLVLAAGVDKRLPRLVALLNKGRAPANAIIIQTILASMLSIVIFCIAPYVVVIDLTSANLTIAVYNVAQASATLVWAISTAFLFINLIVFYVKDRDWLFRQLVVPRFLLFLSVIVGPPACLLAIVDTLFYSWTAVIPNVTWGMIVGGVTAGCLLVSGITSLIANSEAVWEGVLTTEDTNG
ncbi:APC family permease [Ktedonospora formicarum]|uniref:Amino acid permease n=1 Tax=Ktedonospora formicarum TaxID=2778364 RepID=A0A8J3MSP3_9CHLR|nr:APC family permease [Ktedonospora formicarum]GHO46330.1 amino acid permease [Ktedonospora formicarum]